MKRDYCSVMGTIIEVAAEDQIDDGFGSVLGKRVVDGIVERKYDH